MLAVDNIRMRRYAMLQRLVASLGEQSDEHLTAGSLTDEQILTLHRLGREYRRFFRRYREAEVRCARYRLRLSRKADRLGISAGDREAMLRLMGLGTSRPAPPPPPPPPPPPKPVPPPKPPSPSAPPPLPCEQIRTRREHVRLLADAEDLLYYDQGDRPSLQDAALRDVLRMVVRDPEEFGIAPGPRPVEQIYDVEELRLRSRLTQLKREPVSRVWQRAEEFDDPNLVFAPIRLTREDHGNLYRLISESVEMQPWEHRSLRLPTADQQAGDWGEEGRWGKWEDRQ